MQQKTWLQRQLDSLRELAWWQWLTILLITAFLVLIELGKLEKRGESLGVDLVFIPLYAGLAIRFVTTGSSMEPSPLLKKLMETKSGFPVRLSVFVDEVITGQDEGVVSFDGGAIIYSGLHTSFRLRPQDVFVPGDSYADGPLLRAKSKQFRYGNHSGYSAWGFHLLERPECRLYFFPLSARVFSPYARGRGFYQAMFAWLQNKPEADGDTVLPPQGSMPNFRQPWVFRSKKTLPLR